MTNSTDSLGRLTRLKSPLVFFAITFAIGIPFWVLGLLVARPGRVPMDLPWSAIAAVAPMVSAIVLVQRKEGWAGVRRLLQRPFQGLARVRPVWWVPTLVFMPALVGASYLLMRFSNAEPRGTYTSFAMVPLLLVAYFLAAFVEEVGWTGYALDPMQSPLGALPAALILGFTWALFHLIPWIQVHGVTWAGGYAIFTIAARVVMVWLYNNSGGSMLVVILFHDLINTSASLSPYTGSPLSPYVWALLTLAAALLVTFFWGSTTLTRYRYRPDAQVRG